MRSLRRAMLPLLLGLCVGCTSTLRVEPAKPTPTTLGIPYTVMDPVYTVTTGPSPDNPSQPSYTVAVGSRPNPSKQFMIRADPAWLKEVDFSVSIGTGGQLTSAGAATREKLTPTVTNLGQFVGAAIKVAALAAGDTSSSISEMEKRMQNRPTILDPATGVERARTPEETYIWDALLERIRTNAGSPSSQERLLQTFYAATPTEIRLLETVRYQSMTPCPQQNPANCYSNDDVPGLPSKQRKDRLEQRLPMQRLVSALLNLSPNEWRRRHAVCLEEHLRTLRRAAQQPNVVPDSLLGLGPTETAPLPLPFPFPCGQIDTQLLQALAAVPGNPANPDEVVRQRKRRQELIRAWFPNQVAARVLTYEQALADTIGATSEYRALQQLEGILAIPIGNAGGAATLDAYQATAKAADDLRERIKQKRAALAAPPANTSTSEAQVHYLEDPGKDKPTVDTAHATLNSKESLKNLPVGSFVLVIQRRGNP